MDKYDLTLISLAISSWLMAADFFERQDKFL